MAGRLSRGWSMAKASFAVLKQYPKLAVLPAMSGAIFLVVVGLIVASLMPQLSTAYGTTGSIWRRLGEVGDIWLFVALFAALFVMTAVAIFFNVALIYCALRAHAGEQPSIRGGLSAAVGLLPQILSWALVATTVGVLLNMLQEAIQNYLGFLGKFLGGLLELSWAVIAYFVVPVLVTEKVGPITAIKRSSAILRAKWGESLAGEARIGLLGMLAVMVSALIFFGGLALVLSSGVKALVGVGAVLMALAVVAGVASMVVVQTLSTIFQSGVYLYATTGQVPATLDRDLLDSAFQPKK
jgi:Family of unknown function (DUF6159)